MTIDSLTNNAEGEIEILVMEGSGGMRSAINEGLSKAKGKYLMKCDAHCAFDKWYDKVLVEDCEDDWLMVPRRYSLSSETWSKSGRVRDYHYLMNPVLTDAGYGSGLFNVDWYKANDILIDDTMSFQGSCWFAHRDYFMDKIGFLDDRPEAYGTFAQEYLEIGMKYWLGGGSIKVNKKTWYAHLCKRKHHYASGEFSRRYKKDEQSIRSCRWAAEHWMNNREPNMVHSFQWLIDKFQPIPTWA